MLISATTSAPLLLATSMVARSAMPNGEPPEPTFSEETPDPLPTSIVRSMPAFVVPALRLGVIERRMIRRRRPVQDQVDGLGGRTGNSRHGKRKRQSRNSQPLHGNPPCLQPTLSPHAGDATNATRDQTTCQLFGWKCPKNDLTTTKPQRRDPAATRRKLLTAARREFASQRPRRRPGRRDRRARRRQQAARLSLLRRQGRAVSGGARMGL